MQCFGRSDDGPSFDFIPGLVTAPPRAQFEQDNRVLLHHDIITYLTHLFGGTPRMSRLNRRAIQVPNNNNNHVRDKRNREFRNRLSGKV